MSEYSDYTASRKIIDEDFRGNTLEVSMLLDRIVILGIYNDNKEINCIRMKKKAAFEVVNAILELLKEGK